MCRLPKINEGTAKYLEACEHELLKMPKPIDTEPAIYMLKYSNLRACDINSSSANLIISIVTSLCNDVKQHTEGNIGTSPDSSSTLRLVQRNRQLFATFMVEIRDTAPKFVIRLRNDREHASRADHAKSNSPSTDDASYPIYLDDMKKHIQKFVARLLSHYVKYTS